MKKVKLLKNFKDIKKGTVLNVTNNVAFGLIDKGIARIEKSIKKATKAVREKRIKRYRNKQIKRYTNK